MNILFLMMRYTVGGVEVVSQTLANRFYNNGHNVCLVTFEEPPSLLTQKLDKSIDVIILDLPIYSSRNIKKLHDLIVERNVDFIINQWGLPFAPTRLGYKAKMGTKAKYISVLHNIPNVNERILNVEIAISKTRNPFKKLFLSLKKRVFRYITAKSMHYVYAKSDDYILLSKSFIPIFKEFTGIKKANKLHVLTNPITVDNSGFNYKAHEKDNEVIYVGRIDYNQKRVHRVIDTWELVEKEYPEWRLTIIGDGPSKNDLETLVMDKKLKNVSFEGFRSPIDYYKRASILMLTSEYEGFPLVIPESMSFGVVPIVYGSYPAVYDIIESGENGLITPTYKDEFNVDLMAKNLLMLMNDKVKLDIMSQNAISSSKRFSIEDIYGLWMDLFSNAKIE